VFKEAFKMGKGEDYEVGGDVGTELVPVEVVEPSGGSGSGGRGESQLEFEFGDRVSDAAWAFRVDGRKRAIEQVIKGLLALGFNHSEVSSILMGVRERSKEMELAVMELADRMKGKGA
jgi:hypothetical protein